ncbi:MAG: MerR family transcriptional regulator [Pseudonocardiales bacterium]|nr:MerR family transcriptional regulator [Pseudonocardiales bacterium]
MRIGQVAAEAGVNVPTLRYYERRGLLPTPPRGRPSGYRSYEPDAVLVVRFVKRAQHLGFSLDEIQTLLHLADGDRCAPARALAMAKIADMDQRIAALHSMRGALERLVATCDTPETQPDCPILQALEEPS